MFICHLHRFYLQSPTSTSIHIHQYVCSKIWIPQSINYSYGHLSVKSTYNPIYRMYNPIYNQL